MPGRPRRTVRVVRIAALLLVVLAAFGVAALTAHLDVPPRSLAPYVERRLSQHGPMLEAAGRWAATPLTQLDRGPGNRHQRPQWRIGVRAGAPAGVPAGQRVVSVATPEQIAAAIADAQPGDAITLEPGSY